MFFLDALLPYCLAFSALSFLICAYLVGDVEFLAMLLLEVPLCLVAEACFLS